MGKRARASLADVHAHRKVRSSSSHQRNEFNRLPDNVLISILSLLSMRDVARTAAVSRRFQYLWGHFLATLDFNSVDATCGYSFAPPLIMEESRTYKNWVWQVLGEHKGDSIDGLRVRFDLSSDSSADINAWVSLAMKKHARELCLDLRVLFGVERPEPYVLMEEKRQSPSTGGGVPAALRLLQVGSLMSLTLRSVEITGDGVEHFIFHCPFLELVFVERSMRLVDLNVVGGSLKHLEISQCDNFRSLRISGANISSFSYEGDSPMELPFNGLSLISKLVVRGEYSRTFWSGFNQISQHLSHLECFAAQLPIEY